VTSGGEGGRVIEWQALWSGHAQAPAVLNHSRALPQGDGGVRPALAGGEEGGRVQAGSLRHRRRGPRYLSSSLPVRVPAPLRVGVRAPWNSMELHGTPWNSVLSLGLTHHEGRPMSSGSVSKEFEAFARDCVQLAAQADSQELRERLLSIARDWMRAAMEEDDATPSTNRALRRRKLQPSRGAA
jgi:hypothetical protein